jgi:hypothetical protein
MNLGRPAPDRKLSEDAKVKGEAIAYFLEYSLSFPGLSMEKAQDYEKAKDGCYTDLLDNSALPDQYEKMARRNAAGKLEEDSRNKNHPLELRGRVAEHIVGVLSEGAEYVRQAIDSGELDRENGRDYLDFIAQAALGRRKGKIKNAANPDLAISAEEVLLYLQQGKTRAERVGKHGKAYRDLFGLPSHSEPLKKPSEYSVSEVLEGGKPLSLLVKGYEKEGAMPLVRINYQGKEYYGVTGEEGIPYVPVLSKTTGILLLVTPDNIDRDGNKYADPAAAFLRTPAASGKD